MSGMMNSDGSMVDVRNLSVRFGDATVVNEVSYQIAAGEKFALVGESGSGKTVSALAMMGLLPEADISGHIGFAGQDILAMREPRLRERHVPSSAGVGCRWM